MAKHRGAAASRAGSGCMGLFGGFCISVPPGMVVELFGNDGLPALVYMHMPHGLLARLVQLGQRLQRGAAITLSLERQPPIAFGGIDVVTHVHGATARQFGKHRVQCDSLCCEHPAGHRQITRRGLVGLCADVLRGSATLADDAPARLQPLQAEL